MYCDEHGTDTEQECPYHDLYDCRSCGGDNTVQLHQGGPNPEEPDQWECFECDWSQEA